MLCVIIYYKCVCIQDTYICVGICLSKNLFTVLTQYIYLPICSALKTHLFLLDVNTLGDFN